MNSGQYLSRFLTVTIVNIPSCRLILQTLIDTQDKFKFKYFMGHPSSSHCLVRFGNNPSVCKLLERSSVGWITKSQYFGLVFIGYEEYLRNRIIKACQEIQQKILLKYMKVGRTFSKCIVNNQTINRMKVIQRITSCR